MKQRIKLLLAIPHLGGGGAERVIANLAWHLDPQRFEIHLVLLTEDGPGAEASPEWVIVHRFEARRVRNAWFRLLRLIRAERPDVILSGMAHLNFLLLLLKPFFPRRTALLIRQNTTASTAATSVLTRRAYRYLYPRADRIICQSQNMADDLCRSFGIVPEKLVVLTNPVDVAGIRAAYAAQIESHSATAPHLLCVGRLSPEKGVDLLLHALPAVKAIHPNVHLTILGTGSVANYLQQLAVQLGLENAVTFAGYTDPANYYATTTLFVLPSRYEGMPNALLEAAAAGLPITATPCCTGVMDLLHGAPGVWCTPAITQDALAETILTALAELKSSPHSQARINHAFLAPFELPTAIAAYASLIENAANQQSLAMIIPTIDQIGGAERQVLLLSKELASRGWRVTLIALSGNGQAAAAELAAAKVEFLSLEMRKAWIDPRGWLRYRAWFRKHRPAIVHAHLPHATWFARWVRLLAPIRVLIDTIHTSKTTSNAGGPGRPLGYKLSNWLTNQVTCVSEAVAQAALTAGLASHKRLRIIPNGVILPPSPQPRNPNQNFQWIAIGRLSPVKDYPTLLHAFGALPGQPNLQIVGTGPEEARLHDLAAELEIESRIHFAGFKADVQPLLAAADAFVLSSLWEGLPISVLEASAASLPVVATEAAGTREAMLAGGEYGQTGLLVPIADPVSLTEAMTQIMLMPEEQRLQMGANGRRFVETNFSLSKVVDQWEDLYTELLRDHPNPARRA